MNKSQAAGPNKKTLSHLCQQPPVNLEFQDLTYTVPQGRKDSKLILKSVSGEFRSGHLSAILGPSGAGKSTLLNVLAGYKTIGAEGSITINGQPRNMSQFRKLSRYIMQDNLLQSVLTAQEYMMVAADLKLNRGLSKTDKQIAISEIFEILRLTSAKDTLTDKLSGGERKRLSIALELLNNPSIIFLDEPTSGLDDVASSQCISLMKHLAEGGRTVICSIHAPSARLFSKFDHAYVIAEGQCTFQGYGQEIVPFMDSVGLACPKNYNPADFIIEVSNGDYGSELFKKLSSAIDNGRNVSYCKNSSYVFEDVSSSTTHKTHSKTSIYLSTTTTERPLCTYQPDRSTWYQFRILLGRFWLQHFRNLKFLMVKLLFYFLLGFVVGLTYLNIGQDGSKALFNYGFCIIINVAFLYLTLMPILLHFPTEVQLMKREYFNQWYGLGAYYAAMSITTLSMHIITTACYLSVAYTMSAQPLELQRIAMFYLICILTVLISESLGLMLGSLLDIVHGSFTGPCLSVPLIILAMYGMGQGSDVPILIRILMHFSYLRLAAEGLVISVNGNGRPLLPCPDEEVFCPFRDPKFIISYMGMENVVYWINVVALIIYFIVFRLAGFYLLRQRLRPNKTFAALQAAGRIIKPYIGITR